MRDKIRVGFIGCGGIAREKHMEAYRYHSAKSEMVAFCDTDFPRAQTLCDVYGARGAKAYADHHEMLKDGTIDMVVVCTPNAMHAQNTIDALEAGKHVMCEKPMAHSLAAAEAMVDSAKKCGKKLSISYQFRFREDSLAIKDFVEAGELGEIYYARAQAIRRRAVPTWGRFLSMDTQGGGALIDYGTHALDLTLWLMNNYEVDSVSGVSFHKLGQLPKGMQGNPNGSWDPARFEVEDSAMGFIKMKNGATILLESAWALNTLEYRPMVATLCGTKGGAVQNPGPWGPTTYTYAINKVIGNELVTVSPNDFCEQSDLNQRIDESTVEAPRKEMDQWLDAIIKDTAPVVLPEQALTVTRILDAVYRSSNEGRPIYF
ncbi:Gfo/Idh/MocA family oxidoreductase [Ruminococcaceae bacterium OttesenSCG-928-D13]|nr:Gfo/Idh/MocA family oxidoreductase [Ruminococcaceae bacterium OttesenSCG-928-D13]